ncbi:ATP-dependent zinc metalloprotease FtsH [Salinisphaera sp. LB1]|uniref:ATP-dependent zinc metalloprotease FtsH n=1 Tax=Salinisphaera sp. LB1 TaxID=2183911 RepID=UPI000D708DC6|nr:ATP-dependent zinc metalloprotease FtsH [Salinisphaera sp. LB1]AWN17162.1 Cell division protein FtsH [Salinisphaera sp. LB1]
MNINKNFYPYIWSVLIPVLVLIAMVQFSTGGSQPAKLPYSAFQHELTQGHIKSVVVGQRSISGEFKQPQNGKRRFTTLRVPPDIRAELDKAGVTYRGAPDTSWIGALLSWILPMGLFLAVWVFLMRRMGGGNAGAGGFMQVGKSRAKIYVETDTKVAFDDVAGVDEAKEELVELIDFLKDPKRYGTLGAHIPKGVLLVGPPGTGKTLLARAVAGEAEVPFFSISGSEFVEMFVGVGAARVRDLFQQARAKAPAIIFIDELDALGRARGVFNQGGNDEREQTLNQLLVELDGFDPSGGLVLLAATNRPEVLDPALLRAGRFDRQVLVDRPDKAGRIQILEVHAKKIRLAEDVALEQVAALTTGFTGADLANLVNEAALLATRRRAESVTMADFNNAIERIVAGLEKKNRILNAREREIVAHHEMGHALMARLLPGVDPVHKVSIIPRGIGALGYTLQRPIEDRFLMTREELENKIAVLLGGRAAEKLIFEHLSTGAADDLSKATDLARSMVARYGMDEQLGYVTYDNERPSYLGPGYPGQGQRLFSEHTADAIDRAVRTIIHDVFERVYTALEKNRAVLERGAQELLEHETLEAADLDRLEMDLAEPRRSPAKSLRRGAAK